MSEIVGSDSGRVIKVHLARENETRTIPRDDVEDLLQLVKLLGLPIDGVLVLENGLPLPLDRTLKGTGPELTVINVASGG